MKSFASLLVRCAYFLENSPRYSKAKEFCRMLLEYPHSKLKFYFDIFMVILVVVSVLFLLYEVKHPEEMPYIDAFIQFSLIVFIIEYLLRFWIYSDSHKIILERYENALNNDFPFSAPRALGSVVKKKLKYVFSPLAIIDLLAILPSYRPLRFLRIFLLFRIFKLFRYAKSIKTFTTIIQEKRFELYTLAIFAGFVVFTGSSAIYIFETHDNPKINTLFDAIYWAIVTMGTVGYGDIVPLTHEGMVVAIVLIIVGIASFAFLTSIIVSSFQSKLSELKEDRVLLEIEKLEDYIVICGYGRIGEVVAKMLHENKYDLIVIDNDPDKINLVRQRGLIGVIADASRSRTLSEVGVGKRASQIICTTNSDELNIFITLTARSLSKHINIIARVVKSIHKKKYFLAGANHAFSTDETIGLMGAQYITQPASYAAMEEMLTESTGIVFEMITIHEYSSFLNHHVKDLALSDKRILLFGILRKSEIEPFYFNPDESFQLQIYDILIVMGRKHPIHLFRKLNDKGNPHARG